MRMFIDEHYEDVSNTDEQFSPLTLFWDGFNYLEYFDENIRWWVEGYKEVADVGEKIYNQHCQRCVKYLESVDENGRWWVERYADVAHTKLFSSCYSYYGSEMW
jgi:hypothetical protein